jgi:hypothetical protein
MRFAAVTPEANKDRIALGGGIVAALCVVLKTTSWGDALSISLDNASALLTYHVLEVLGIPVVRYESSLVGPQVARLEVGNSFFPLLLGLVASGLWPPARRNRYVHIPAALGFAGLALIARPLFGYLLSLSLPRVGMAFDSYVWPSLMGILILAMCIQLWRRPASAAEAGARNEPPVPA